MSHPGSSPQQQNGTTPTSGQSSRAAQYRRQGSSYGPGHVHNMAVMVAPTRVDYSVTKGGLRSWIVLIVFILLCSALLTIFSDEKNDDERIDENMAASSVAEEEPEISVIDEKIEEQKEEAPSIDSTDDDKDEDAENEKEVRENLEEVMLAKLRQKAQMHEERRKPEKKAYKSKIVQIEEDDDEDEDDEDDEEDDDEDDDSDEDENDENKGIELKEARKKEEQRTEKEKYERKVAESHKEEEFQKKEIIDEEDDDNEEEDDENESEAELFQKRQRKAIKRQKRRSQKNTYLKSWRDSSVQAQRLADDVRNPRKNLLKLKKTNKRLTKDFEKGHQSDDDENDEDEVEDDNNVYRNDENLDNEELVSQQNAEPLMTTEMIAPRKKSTNYDRKAITNRDDFRVRNELDDADFRLEKHDFDGAEKIYDQILRQNPESPRALFGKAHALQLRSEFDEEGSNALIDDALALYQRVLDNDDTPDELFRLAADNFIECARWVGNLHKVLTVQRALIDTFPERLSLQNDFAVTFLQMGRVEDARKVFSIVLEIEPSNSVAQAYYGYIFKVYDKELEKGVLWMRKGLRSSHNTIHDPKFFFHLGDALTRLSRSQEAVKVYEEGVALGVFPSVYQRSMHNLEGLTARPWWTLDQSGCGKHLRHIERQWTVIREEALTVWEEKRAAFGNEESHVLDGIEMAIYLRKDSKFVKGECRTNFPNTCEVLKKLVDESSCGKDEIKISVLFAGSRIWPHCAPTNYELEAQLGLVTPSEARIRVGQETRGWKSGRFLVFDKSFEHEIWFDGASANALRIVLTVDLWHPQVPRSFRMHGNGGNNINR